MEPSTIVGLIVAAKEAADEAAKQSDFAQWQGSVTKKLNQILQNTEEILIDLKRLRVEMEANLDTRFQTYYLATLTAALSDVGDVLAGLHGAPPNDDARKRLQDTADELRFTLKQSLAYGFAVLPFTLAGYTVLIPAMRIAKVHPDEINETKRSMVDLVFGPAVDPIRPGSFKWAAVEATRNADEIRARVVSGMRPVTVGLVYWMTKKPGINPSVVSHFTVTAGVTKFSGDPNSPDSISATEIEWKVVEDAEAMFPSTTFSNASPPPIPGAFRAVSKHVAETVRQDWIKQYRAWAHEMNENVRRYTQLEIFVDEIRRVAEIN
jgi:hypothetical protein